MSLAAKTVLVTGGTGSLGQALVRRLLTDPAPSRIVVFSRDEAKQDRMRHDLGNDLRLTFRLGDVRDPGSVAAALHTADVVFHCAALKQVPSCESAPAEAAATNIDGAQNIVRALETHPSPTDTVVFVSTDKACQPVNVMGMTKAIAERLFTQANLRCDTRFVGVRYGNVLESRGSVIPLFRRQIQAGGPLSITDGDMTRFLLPLNLAVDTVLAAAAIAEPGEILVPDVGAARIVDVAAALIGDLPIEVTTIGARPGEKIHETLISAEEVPRIVRRHSWFAIQPALEGLRGPGPPADLTQALCSDGDRLMDPAATRALLAAHGMCEPA